MPPDISVTPRSVERRRVLTLAANNGVILPPKGPDVAPSDGRAMRCPVTGNECVRDCESPATCQIKPTIETALEAARAASHALGSAMAAFERCESGLPPSRTLGGEDAKTAAKEEELKSDMHVELINARGAAIKLVRHFERRLSAQRLGPPVAVKPWRPPGTGA